DSPFDLEAFLDSDYAGVSLDRKSTTGGFQFLGKRLISWQCKKQTLVVNSTTEVEYVSAANCCGQRDDGIFVSQDKYVADILKMFDFVIVKTASTPIETNKALLKDEEAEDVDVHLYRSMIGSLMYLTTSKPNIMFDVCACASNYAGASLGRKSTTGGCQFLAKRLISWQCKKQTVVANSTTKAKYVAAANCCGQVLWIQNQMLDYGFNFMNTDVFQKL
ncbi:hypothetical protein Tco_1580649, partial [Tanacetum coccineum]